MPDAKIRITAQDAVSEVMARINDAMKATGAVTVEVSDAMKTGTGSADTFADSIAKLGSSFAARVAEGVLLRDAVHSLIDVVKDGIMALPELVEHTIATGNSLYEMSLKTGASVENLSALRYVASQTGIDFESFGNTLFKMEMALGSSGAKADELQDKLSLLGLDLQTLKNEKPDQAFIDIMSALEEMPNRADQAAIGMALFGKGFKEMAGLTQESIVDLMQEAKDLGLVMSTETAAAAHAAEIGFKGFSMQLEAVGMEVAATVLPALIALTHLVSGEFHSAVESVGHPVVDLKQIIEDVILKLLDWSSVGLSVAQFLDDAFQGTKAMFFDVTGKVVDLGNAFVHLLEMGADLAAKTPLVGKEFLGVRDALKDTNEWLGGFSKGLHDESDGALDAAAKHKAYFDALHGGIADMKANFHDAFVKSGEEIEDFASKSHNAFGGQGSDVEGAKDKVDKYANAWAELNSMGTTFEDTVAQINPKLVQQITYYIEAGAKVSTLAEAYADVLTPAQVEAIDQLVKGNEKYQKSWESTQAAINKVWDDALAIEQEDADTGLQLQLDKIARQQSAEEDQAAKKITDEDQLQAMLVAIQAKYDAQREVATTANTRKVTGETKALWTEYYDLEGRASMSSTDLQIAQIQKWYDDKVEKAIAAGIVDQGYYDALAALSQRKMDDVYQSHSKYSQDTKKLLADLTDGPGGWVDTFSTILVHTGSFTDAAKGVWNLFKQDTLNIFSDLLGGIIHSFLDALLKAVEDYVAKMLVKLAVLTILSFFSGGGVAGTGGGGGDVGGPGSDQGGYADGGIVYAAGGWPQPIGTDTVPAMLTPGERVLTVPDTLAFDRLGGVTALRGGTLGGAALQANIDGLAAQVRRQADAHAALVQNLPMMLRHAMRGA